MFGVRKVPHFAQCIINNNNNNNNNNKEHLYRAIQRTERLTSGAETKKGA